MLHAQPPPPPFSFFLFSLFFSSSFFSLSRNEGKNSYFHEDRTNIETLVSRIIFTAIAYKLVTTSVVLTRTRFRFPGSGKNKQTRPKTRAHPWFRGRNYAKSYARLPPRCNSKGIRDSKSERGRVLPRRNAWSDSTKFLRAVRSTEWVCQRRNIIAFTGTAVGTPLFSFPFRTSQWSTTEGSPLRARVQHERRTPTRHPVYVGSHGWHRGEKEKPDARQLSNFLAASTERNHPPVRPTLAPPSFSRFHSSTRSSI